MKTGQRNTETKPEISLKTTKFQAWCLGGLYGAIGVSDKAGPLVRENAIASFRVDLIQDGDKFFCIGLVCRRGMGIQP